MTKCQTCGRTVLYADKPPKVFSFIVNYTIALVLLIGMAGLAWVLVHLTQAI